MNRLKYLFLLLLIVSLCCACGKTEKNHSEDTDSQTSTELLLPENAEEIVPGIGVALDLDGDDPVISFYDYSDDTATAFYTYLYLTSNLPQNVENCEIFIYTVEESIETSLKSQKEAQKLEDMELPFRWLLFAKKKGLGNGKGTGERLVSEALMEVVEAGVQEYVLDVIEAYYADDKTDSNAETEALESERKLLKSKDYELDQMKIKMYMSQDTENALHFNITIKSEVDWKLAYSFIIYKSILEVEELNTVIMAYNDEVFLSTLGLSMLTNNNTIIDTGEWCADQIISEAYDAKEAEVLGDELQSFVADFFESFS